MKFEIDKRFFFVQAAKAIIGYLIGLSLVISFLDIEDKFVFITGSLMSAIVLIFVLFYPRKIILKDYLIEFVDENGIFRNKLDLSNVKEIMDCSCKCYNTISVITKEGNEYKLHPSEKDALESYILHKIEDMKLYANR